MKQYILKAGTRGLEGLKLENVSIPKPGRGEILVKVHAVSLNFRDLFIASLERGSDDVVPVSDGAGEVVEVGPEVTRFKKGDRVAGAFFPDWAEGTAEPEAVVRSRGGPTAPGMLAEYVTGRAADFVKIPEGYSYAEAATLPCAGVTAWHVLSRTSALRPGTSVLLLGTGGVSIFALQLAKAAGAQVLITSSQDEKLERAKKLGADHVINYAKVPAWDEEVRRLTGGKGVDVVVEVGGGGTLERSLNALKLGGKLGLVGVLTGGTHLVNPMAIFQKNAGVEGILVGSQAMQAQLGAFLEQHRIHPVIDRTFRLDEVRAGLEYLAAGKHFGKVVVEVAG